MTTSSPTRRAVALLLAVFASLFALAAPAAAAPKFGYGDNRPTMFGDQRWQALPLKDARRTVDWDVQKYPDKIASLDEWMAAAQAAGARPLLAIDRSWSPGQGKKKPSVKEYSKLVKWLKQQYPQLKRLTPWNEANYYLQPTAKNPKLAWSYWKAAKKACKGCTVTSPAILSGGTGTAKKFLPTFRKLAGKKIKVWAVHVYGDQNRRKDTGLRQLEKQLPGRLWVTETAAWVKFGSSSKWKYDEKRAAKVIDYVFKSAKKHRKKVDYWYFWQWLGDPNPTTTRWDSGVLNFDGSERLGYQSLLKGLGK